MMKPPIPTRRALKHDLAKMTESRRDFAIEAMREQSQADHLRRVADLLTARVETLEARLTGRVEMLESRVRVETPNVKTVESRLTARIKRLESRLAALEAAR